MWFIACTNWDPTVIGAVYANFMLIVVHRLNQIHRFDFNQCMWILATDGLKYSTNNVYAFWGDTHG